jgi:Tfp pilus assembly protein FimT
MDLIPEERFSARGAHRYFDVGLHVLEGWRRSMTTIHGSAALGGRRRSVRLRGHRGISALELLVVVGILAILAGIGTPALLGALERSRLEAGASELVGALRRAQADAVSQGGFFRVHLGSDPAVGRPNSFRIERSTNGAVWPSPADTIATSPLVVTEWVDLARQYPGLTVGFPVDSSARTLTWITYNSRGAFVDPTGPVTPPASIPVQNLSGATRTVVGPHAPAPRGW